MKQTSTLQKDAKPTDNTAVGFDEATKSEGAAEEDENPEAKAALARATTLIYDPYTANQGSCLTFTFKEGLIAKVLPNGDIQQNLISNSAAAKKFAIIQDQNESNEEKKEV